MESDALTPLGFSFEWDLLLTCPGWIEDLVKTELLEKANAEIKFLWQGRGVLRIKTTADPQYFIDNIRSIHRVLAYVHHEAVSGFEEVEAESFKEIAERADWVTPAGMWKRRFPTKADPIEAPTDVTFRVKTERRGRHKVSSLDIDRKVGAVPHVAFGWKGKMKEYEMLVVCSMHDGELYFGLSLENRVLSKRNRVAIGRTTLNCAVCYALCRMANIKPGDVVMDPLAGVGMIPIEGYQSWKDATFICGDICQESAEKAAVNCAAFTDKKVSCFKWDSRHLPLRDSTIDIIISDIPFGQRHGSHPANRKLYPLIFKEFRRVLRLGGRVILLTTERTIMRVTLARECTLGWDLTAERWCDNGGYKATVYELVRTNNPKPFIIAKEDNRIIYETN